MVRVQVGKIAVVTSVEVRKAVDAAWRPSVQDERRHQFECGAIWRVSKARGPESRPWMMQKCTYNPGPVQRRLCRSADVTSTLTRIEFQAICELLLALYFQIPRRRRISASY